MTIRAVVAVASAVRELIAAVCQRFSGCSSSPIDVEACIEDQVASQCQQVDCDATFEGDRNATRTCVEAIAAMSCELLVAGQTPEGCR